MLGGLNEWGRKKELSKRTAILKLYHEGKISSGLAAKNLNIPMTEFIELLKEMGVRTPIKYEDFMESQKAVRKIWK